MMRFLTILSFSIFISNIKVQALNYSCSTNDLNVDFSLSFLSHSAWEPTTNCALSQCNVNSTINTRCHSLTTPCFNYLTINNISLCAPAIQCSILELCNNNTNQCTSNTSVCVTNSCCSTQAVCLPLSITSFCSPVQTILWTFDNTLNDITGEFAGVNLNSPTYTSGINGYGTALSLNGTIGQCAIIAPYLNINNQSFTWELWLYPTTTTVSSVTLIGQCSRSGAVDQCLQFSIVNNTIQFSFGNDDIIGTTQIPANSWSHMASVYDIVANKKFIYFNGILEGIQNSTGPLQVASTNMTFGCLNTDNGTNYTNYFTGYLDQILYSYRVKTANEILDDATLVVHYRFLSGELSIDSGPNEINGTLGGGAVSISSGVVDQAIDFPLNQSYFSVTGLVLLGTSNWPFSFSLWYKSNSLNDSLLVHVSSGTGGGWCPLYFGSDSNGALYMGFRIRITALQSISGPIMPIGVWNHIVFTYSAANGVRLYVNGIFNSVTPGPLTFFSNGMPKTLIIGNPLVSSGCAFLSGGQSYASVDEFRLYSREITSSEVSQLFSNP